MDVADACVFRMIHGSTWPEQSMEIHASPTEMSSTDDSHQDVSDAFVMCWHLFGGIKIDLAAFSTVLKHKDISSNKSSFVIHLITAFLFY